MRILISLLLVASLSFACSAQDEKGGKKKKGAGIPKAKVIDVPGLTRTGSLQGVRESSGIALGTLAGTFWTHGDHGSRPELYQVNWQGERLQTVPVPGATAVDWEGLAHDDKGRLYIGDLGNNANDRRDLTIYRFDPATPEATAARIQVRYADQQEFPPADKRARNFDCEALLWRGGKLYLFTRDRGQHTSCRLYELPDAPGEAVAKYVGTYELEGEISGADLSPDGRQLALVGHGKLFLVALPSTSQLLGGTVRTIPLPGAGQTEGVAYADARTLIITAEQGTVYRYGLTDK